MSDAVICKYEDIKSENFCFKGPKKDDSRYYVFLTHKLDSESLPQKIYVQSSKMRVKTSLDEAFADFTLPSNIDFSNFVGEIDMNVLSKIKEKKDEWFEGKGIEDSFFEVGQNFSIKPDGEKGTSKLKLRISKDTTVYNSNKEEVSLSDVALDTEVSCILQLMGIWFTKSRWGLTWQTVQIRTHSKKREVVKTYMFSDVDDDDIDILDPPPGLDK